MFAPSGSTSQARTLTLYSALVRLFRTQTLNSQYILPSIQRMFVYLWPMFIGFIVFFVGFIVFQKVSTQHPFSFINSISMPLRLRLKIGRFRLTVSGKGVLRTASTGIVAACTGGASAAVPAMCASAVSHEVGRHDATLGAIAGALAGSACSDGNAIETFVTSTMISTTERVVQELTENNDVARAASAGVAAGIRAQQSRPVVQALSPVDRMLIAQERRARARESPHASSDQALSSVELLRLAQERRARARESQLQQRVVSGQALSPADQMFLAQRRARARESQLQQQVESDQTVSPTASASSNRSFSSASRDSGGVGMGTQLVTTGQQEPSQSHRSSASSGSGGVAMGRRPSASSGSGGVGMGRRPSASSGGGVETGARRRRHPRRGVQMGARRTRHPRHVIPVPIVRNGAGPFAQDTQETHDAQAQAMSPTGTLEHGSARSDTKEQDFSVQAVSPTEGAEQTTAAPLPSCRGFEHPTCREGSELERLQCMVAPLECTRESTSAAATGGPVFEAVSGVVSYVIEHPMNEQLAHDVGVSL